MVQNIYMITPVVHSFRFFDRPIYRSQLLCCAGSRSCPDWSQQPTISRPTVHQPYDEPEPPIVPCCHSRTPQGQRRMPQVTFGTRSSYSNIRRRFLPSKQLSRRRAHAKWAPLRELFGHDLDLRQGMPTRKGEFSLPPISVLGTRDTHDSEEKWDCSQHGPDKED